jgi:integrase
MGSGWSANKIKNIISKFYNWCYEEGFYTGLNPTIRIKNFPTKFRNRYLNDDEIKRFIKVCFNYKKTNPLPAYALILLLITGKRKGEILNLTWSNLDLAHNTMYLPDSKVGPKSYRFSDRAKELFIEIKNILPKNENDEPLVDFVFPSNSTTGKVKPFRPHDLRHTFATYAAILTKDIRMVQQSLGHTTLKMTQRYAHLIEDDQVITNKLISDKIFRNL